MTKKPTTKTKLNSRTVPVTDTAPVPSPVAVTTAITTPTHEEISRRAYELYIARGQTHGRELEDWTQAEQELLAKAHRNN